MLQITVYSQVWYDRADKEYKTGVCQDIAKQGRDGIVGSSQ